MMDLAVDVLAVHRLVRLVTADSITEPLRRRVIVFSYRPRMFWNSDRSILDEMRTTPGLADTITDDDDTAPRLAELVRCRWCAGVWIGALVVAARRWLPGWPLAARALAVASASTLLARVED